MSPCRWMIIWRWSQLMCLCCTWAGRAAVETLVSRPHMWTHFCLVVCVWFAHLAILYIILLCWSHSLFVSVFVPPLPTRFCSNGTHRQPEKQQDYCQWSASWWTGIQWRCPLYTNLNYTNKCITCEICFTSNMPVCVPRSASRRWDPGAERPVCVRPGPGTDPDAVCWTNPAPEPEAGRTPAANPSFKPPSPSSQTPPGGSQQAPQSQVILRCLNPHDIKLVETCVDLVINGNVFVIRGYRFLLNENWYWYRLVSVR